jgi:cytochrome c oxidase subunit IV
MTPDPTKKPGSANDPLSEQWIDLRLIAGMRVVLGTSALLVVLIQPLSSFRWSKLTYLTLVMYALYGLAIYHLSVRRQTIVAHRIIPWLDLLWYVPLLIFASNTNNLFYYFFFFSIIVASFSWGLSDGLRVTLASAAI